MAIRDTINLLTEDEPLELLDTFRSRRESFDEPATLDLASDPEAEAQDFADMPQEPVEMPPDETEQAERRRLAREAFYSDPANIERLREKDDELPGEGVGLARFRPSAGEEYGIGLRRGGKQLQGLAGGFIGLVSDALGIEAGADWGLEQYRSAMEEAAESEAFITDPFEQIDGIGDAGLYAAGLLGEQTYQLMSSVLGAGIGYGVGRSIANRVIANEIGKRTAAGLTKEAAEKAVRDEVTENALRVASIPVSEKGFSKGGAITGAYLTNFGMISGGTYGQIEEETGLRDPGTAAAFSAGGAALDTLGEVFLASKFLKPFSRGVEAKPGIDLPAKPRTVGGVARSAGLGALTGGAVEGGVEGAQTGIEQAAVGAADPDQTIGERLAAPGASRERAIAAAAGFTVGGALGGPGGVLEALAPRTAQKLRDKGTQENQEQEQPAPSELPGDWSETITVGGLPMRYSEAIDQWAVVNPPENFPNTTNLADGTRVYLVPERTSSGQALSQAARARLSALRGENVEGIEDFTEDEQQEEEGEETELTPFSANTPVLFKPFDGDTQLKAIVRGYDADGNAEIDVFDPENVLGAPEGKARTNLAPWWSEKSGLTQPGRTQPENVGELETARGGLSIGPRIVARREVVSKDQLGRLALDAEAQLTDEQRQRQEALKAELLARRAKPGLDVSDEESSVNAEQEQIDEAQQRDRGESEAFINSLDPGTPVSVIRFNPEGRTTLGRNDGQRFEDAFFLRRLSNGNALFQLRPVRRADQRTSEVPPKGGSREQLEPGVEFQGASPRKEFVAERTANMIELKPSEFNLVTFRGLPTSRPANPIDDQINDIVAALGGNPSGQELAAALGTIYEGPGFPTRSFFRDGVATGNNPGIGIRWRNKRDGSPEKVGQSYGIFGLRWMGEEGTAGRPEKVEMPQIPRKQRQGEDRAAAAERYGREMGTYKNILDGLALNTLRQMDRGLVVEVEGGFEVERMLRDPLRTFELEQIPDTRRATYQEPSKSGRSTVTRTRPRRFRVTAVRWRGNIARQGKNPLDFSISAALDPLSPEAESRARQQLKETGETDYRPSQVAGTQRGLGILKDIYRFDLRRREQSETAQGTSQTSMTRLLQQSRMTDAQLREEGKTREQVEKELADLGNAIVERPDVGIGKLREFAQRTQSGRYEFVATPEARLRAIELSGGREPNKAQLDRAIDETLAAENLTRDEVITALTEFDKSVELLASLDPDARNVVEKLLTDVDNYVNASRQVPTRTPGTARADILDLALVRAKNTRLRDIRMAIERAKKKGGRPIKNLSVRDRGNIMRLYLEALDEIRAERADKRVQAEETKIYGGTRGRSDQIQQLLAEAREAGIQDAATILDRKTPIDKARRLIAEARRGMRRTERSVAPGAGQAQRLMRDIENVVERGGVSGVPDAKSVFERMEALVESGAIPQAKKDLVRTNLLNETQANLEKDFKEAKARVIKKLENDQSRYRDEPARDVFPREKTSKSGKSIAAKRVPARRVLTVPTAQIRAEYDYLENIPKVFGDLLKKNPFFTVVDAVRSAARSLESQQRLGRAESMPQGEPAPAQSQQELLEETSRPDRFGMDAPNFARREYWRRVEDLDNVFGNGARALLFRGFGLTESGKRAVTQGKANQFYRAFLEMTETGKLSPKTLRRWSARKNFPAGDRARFIRILDYLIDPNQYGRRTAQPAARAVGASTQPLTVAQPGVAGDPRTQRGVAPRPDSGPITRGLSAEQLMAGTGESRPEGSARQDGVGGPVGAGGTAASGPGTVRDGAAGGVRGPGIRVASQPRTIRTLSRAATRRLVGLAGRSAGLTDAELAAIPDEEIRRAYVALMTTADQTATLAGRNAIGQSPVPMAERFTQTGEQLLTAAAKENADYMANKQRVDRLRQNIGLALRARAFGNPSEFFKAVAADNQQPANLRMLAKEFLKLQGRGLDIDGVALQVGAFGRNFNSDPITEKEIKSKIRLKDGVYTVSTSAGKVTHSGTPDTNPEGRARATAIRDIQMSRAAKFAGRATRQQTALGDDAVFDTGAYALYINLDAPHPNGSPVGTILHEFNHVVLDAKIDGLIELNPTERAALERLRAERRAAVIEAARRLDIDLPSNPSEAEIDSASQQIYQLAETITPEQLDALGIDNARALDALTSDREFANDIISRPDVADLLVNLGRGKAGGKPTTLLGAIRKAWDALVELISGVKADPNSPLARAFKDSWTLVYASNGAEMDDTSFTMPEVMRSELAAEMQTQAEVNAFIERELDRRNLAGTAEERNRLLSEFRKETEPEAPAQEEGATEEDTEIDEEEQLRLARQRVLRAMGMEGREDDPEVSAFDPDVINRAVEVMSENEFVQWAQANGFQFLDPRAVYRNTILEKAIRDAGKPPVPKQKQKQAKAEPKKEDDDTDPPPPPPGGKPPRKPPTQTPPGRSQAPPTPAPPPQRRDRGTLGVTPLTPKARAKKLLDLIPEENRGQFKTSKGDVQAGTRIYKRSRAKDGSLKETRSGEISQSVHFVTRVVGDKVFTLPAITFDSGSRSAQWNDQQEYSQKDFQDLVKKGDIEIETDPALPMGRSVYSPEEGRMISVMPAATQIDPDATAGAAPVNENAPDFVDVPPSDSRGERGTSAITNADRAKWKRMTDALDREVDTNFSRMWESWDETEPGIEQEIREAANDNDSASAAWLIEYRRVAETFGVDFDKYAEFADFASRTEAPKDPRFQTILNRINQRFANETPEQRLERAYAQVGSLNPTVNELNALIGSQTWFSFGGRAVAGWDKTKTDRGDYENLEPGVKNPQLAFGQLKSWLTPALNSEQPFIQREAEKVLYLHGKMFGSGGAWMMNYEATLFADATRGPVSDSRGERDLRARREQILNQLSEYEVSEDREMLGATVRQTPWSFEERAEELRTELGEINRQLSGVSDSRGEAGVVGRPVNTASEKFKRWFRQSAVTNRLVGGKNDEPLRMYHGSPFDLQAVFRSEADIQREKGVSRWGDFPRLDPEDVGNEGIYFTPDPRYASAYTRARYGAKGANTTPVYLSIQNPYFVNEQDTWWENASRYFNALKAAAKSIAKWNPEPWDEFEAKDSVRFFGRRLDNINNPLSTTWSSGYIAPKELKLLQEQGYDGIINLAPNGNAKLPEIIVFSPTQIKSAITNTGEFSSTNPNISESRIEAFRPRVIEPVTKKTYTGGTYTMKGILRSVFEYLDPRAGDMWLKSRAAIKAEASRVDDLADILKKQLSELKKQGQEFSSDLLNTALGNLENPLTTEQIREIESLSGGRTTFTGEDGETYTTDPAGELRDEYLRANRNAFRAKQRLALKELPENVASTIAEMSAHIESLSKKLPKEGIVHGDLKITVDEALGIYLNRSYAIFDDPKWADKVKKNAPVIAAARRYIKNQLVKDKASELFSIAQESGSPISKEEALRRAGEVVIDDDVETALESYLSVGLDAPSIGILSGRIPGQKNLSILYNRKNIAPEIQALWGRYDDPTINYAKSVLKLASLVSNHQFLKELRAEGLKEGWLWDPNSNTEKPVGFQRIASEKNRSLEPLAGMYAMPEFLRGLETVYSPDTLESHNYLMRYLTKATGITMGMQTVGSVAAQVRNYMGNFLKLLATGNLGLGDIANPEWRKNLAYAHRAAIADVFKRYGKQDRKFWRNEIDKLIRLGVFGESITTNLIDDLVGLSKAATDGQFDNKFNQIIGRPAMQIAKLAQDTYAAGDNIFKAMIFFSERAKYAKAMPELDKQNVDAELGITDLDRKAAQISRDIHWTYSLAPQIVQDLKRGPGVFIAPFITFTTEVIRTTINTFNLARQEIRDGQASGNQDLEAIGWGRIRGLTAAALLPSAVGAGVMAMFGMTGEDEENLRRFLPDWQKNNQLILFGNENGKISFIDMSFLDPHEYFKKPLKAFWRSLTDDDATATERISGSVISAVGEILNPFTSEQIFAGAIADVARNRDEAGRQVWNPQDTAARKGMAVANHIFIQPFMPGTGRSLGRIGAAALGWQGDTGRSYSLPNELASMFAGQRVSQVDVNQALGFSVNRFLRGQRDASTLFTREFTSEGTRSPAGIVSSYDRANEAHLSLVSQMRKDYKAALGLGGMTVDSTRRKMKEAGMGKESIKEVTTGIFTPYQASKEMVDSVRRRGLNDRINAYEQARDMVPQREVLQ